MAQAPELLRIRCNQLLDDAATKRLRNGVGGHSLIDDDGEPAQVWFGQPPLDTVLGHDALRWVHLSSAGYTAYDRSDVRERCTQGNVAFTKSSLVYDDPCAEHVLSLMLAGARQLPAAWQNQHGRQGWPKKELRARSRLLRGQAVVLVGFGRIAERLVELLSPFEVAITALRRSPRGDEPVTTSSWNGPEASETLARADHVVNLLPENSETIGLFDGAKLKSIKAGATFYNIGRGTTMDPEALGQLLDSGHLAAAFLDVTDPEPLPPGHPLWTTPNCHISPHTAGGHHDEDLRLVEHFLDNLRRFESGEPLIDRVW